MNPSCCRSPLQIAVLPPIAHAAIAVLVLVAVVGLLWLGWRWMSGPRARHAMRVCDPLACSYCERDARNRNVATYAAQAREREKARTAQRGEGAQ